MRIFNLWRYDMPISFCDRSFEGNLCREALFKLTMWEVRKWEALCCTFLENCSFLTSTIYQYSTLCYLFICIEKLRMILKYMHFLFLITYDFKDFFPPGIYNRWILEQEVHYFKTRKPNFTEVKWLKYIR